MNMIEVRMDNIALRKKTGSSSMINFVSIILKLIPLTLTLNEENKGPRTDLMNDCP